MQFSPCPKVHFYGSKQISANGLFQEAYKESSPPLPRNLPLDHELNIESTSLAELFAHVTRMAWAPVLEWLPICGDSTR